MCLRIMFMVYFYHIYVGFTIAPHLIQLLIQIRANTLNGLFLI